jgi:hypothetical protein
MLFWRLVAEKVARLHEPKRAFLFALQAKPIEHLQELKLVIKVVLEPEDDPIEARGAGEPAISGLQDRSRLIQVAAVAGKIIRADIGQVGERVGNRHRPFVEHVAPREHLNPGHRVPEQCSS